MPNKFKFRFESIKILAPIYLNTNLSLDKSKLNKLVDIVCDSIVEMGRKNSES